MGDPLEVVDIRPINSELVPVKESPVNATWKNFECSTERKKSLQARYVYGFIFLLTNLLAWLIRDYGHKIFPKLHYLKACGVGGLECSHTNGVLRGASFLFCQRGFFVSIFFFLMFLTTLKTGKLYEARNAWHSRWWTIKFVLMFISLTFPFFCPSLFIQYYGEVARIGAG
ncbi:Serinc-domain containing serine and sphingolipid biosynthesis protein [Thalictrum thalictroides]|uniref:Serinc-domain containing serine and sphingolipid biosynthesis protein n=1 Tax=Thalictrum thalictroides TaxID=46969 RepID=A0A7J6WGH7_THATH|nr:Serinc-domain containing serine and sphingolipid biosynthesis protein [Thalictrum thalictroides]